MYIYFVSISNENDPIALTVFCWHCSIPITTL